MLTKSDLFTVLRLILRPILRLCLERGARIQDLLECIKAEMVLVAQELVRKKGDEVTLSRISVITGIHRKEVERLKDGNLRDDKSNYFIAKVIGQWQGDKKFNLRGGKPRPLSFGFDDSDFNSLIKRVRTDINPATVLYELERIGAVIKKDDSVILCVDSYMPMGNYIEGYSILGKDLDDLLFSVQENIHTTVPTPNLHIRTEYDKIRDDSGEEIKRWLLREGHKLHASAREFISKHDQDVNPLPKYKGGQSKVVLTSFARLVK